jgi:hypothetical protein
LKRTRLHKEAEEGRRRELTNEDLQFCDCKLEVLVGRMRSQSNVGCRLNFGVLTNDGNKRHVSMLRSFISNKPTSSYHKVLEGLMIYK